MKKTEEDIELEIEKIKAQKNAQIKKLQAQKRKIRAANSAETRKQRNRILFTAGALLGSCVEGNAANININELAAYIDENRATIASRISTKEPRSMAEAAEALKDWEKRAKEAKRAEKEWEKPSETTTAEQGNAEEEKVANETATDAVAASDQPGASEPPYPYRAPAWQPCETV